MAAVLIGCGTQRTQKRIELVLVYGVVDHAQTHGLLRHHRREVVGCGIEPLDGYASRSGYLIEDRLPCRLCQSGHLAAVLVRHACHDVWLDGTLVGACCGSEHLGLDAETIQQRAEEGYGKRYAAPIDFALRLYVYAIRRRGEVVLPLRIGVGVCHDELAREFESLHGGAQLLHDGRRGRTAARGVDTYSDDALVACGMLYRADGFEQCEGLTRGKGLHVEVREGRYAGRVGYVLGHVDDQNAALLHPYRLYIERIEDTCGDQYPYCRRQHHAYQHGRHRRPEYLGESYFFALFHRSNVLYRTKLLHICIACNPSCGNCGVSALRASCRPCRTRR